MLRPIDAFFLVKYPHISDTLQALRVILTQPKFQLTEQWKYGLPFYYFKNKPFIYIWKEKKGDTPYLGIVKGLEINHPLLQQGNRKKMKILPISIQQEIPVNEITAIILKLQQHY